MIKHRCVLVWTSYNINGNGKHESDISFYTIIHCDCPLNIAAENSWHKIRYKHWARE